MMEMPIAAAAGVEGRPVLRVRDLQVHFPVTSGMVLQRKVGAVHAVDGVSFDLHRGEILALVGESGCGKSTTGRALLHLLPPTGGRVEFDGVDTASLRGEALRRLRRRMQMIFQDPYASLSPRVTIHDTLVESLAAHGVGVPSERDGQVIDLMTTVGLRPDLRNRYPHELSGGQRQRVGIARALALSPELIVADEPTSALDVSVQAQIINLIKRLQRERRLSYIFISHNISVVRAVSNRIAVMYLGRIVEIGPTREVIAAPRHPYTRALVSAVRSPDPEVERQRRRIVLPGDPPSPLNPPTGCRFHNRCWLRPRLGNPEACVATTPRLLPAGPRHDVACHFSDQMQNEPQ